MQKWSDLWNSNQVAFAPFLYRVNRRGGYRAKGNDFQDIEQFLEDAALGYTNPERFEDYGRFLFGESHRNIFVALDRPSLSRTGLNCYYSGGECPWRMRLRGGSDDILQLVRRITERYRSIGQVSYDELKPVPSGEEYWHNPGGFWYRGLWWGSITAEAEIMVNGICE
jgi:hypothetical protein